MNEQEVWVRMMAAILTAAADLSITKCTTYADEAVAEWRKRYGAKAEPAPAPFKVGDCDHTGCAHLLTDPPKCARCGETVRMTKSKQRRIRDLDRRAIDDFVAGARVVPRNAGMRKRTGTVISNDGWEMVTVRWDDGHQSEYRGFNLTLAPQQEPPCDR